MRTPTGCYVSTSRKAPTCASMTPPGSRRSPRNSTIGRARRWAGTPQPGYSSRRRRGSSLNHVSELIAAGTEDVCLSADDAAELAELLRFWHDWLTGEDTDLLAASLDRMPDGPD